MRSVLLLNVLAVASAASMARDFANKRADGKKGGGLRQLKPGDGFEPKGAKPKKSESERAKKHERAKKERVKRAKEFDLHEEVAEIKEEAMQVESETETGWLPTPSPTTLPPVPTPLPTLDPLEEATLAPSVDVLETIEPSEDVLAEEGARASSGPPCPTSYDSAFTNYVAGDEVEMDGSVFICLVAPYEKYCNIAQKDEENWSEEVMTLWGEAWEYVGPCEMAKAELVESEGVVIAPPLPEAPVTTDAPVQTTEATVTTTTATNFPTTAVYPTPSPTLDTLEELPAICPLPYNPTKTTYAAGDIAEVHEHIFRCREGGKVIDTTGTSAKYELYCGVPSWDEALLEDNPLAEEMWNDSWVYVEPCQLRTMEQVLEEEALGA